jgi:hypothetical protein
MPAILLLREILPQKNAKGAEDFCALCAFLRLK